MLTFSLGEREAIRGLREELQLHLGCRGHSWFGFIIHKMGVIGPTTRPCGVAWPVTALEPRPHRGGRARCLHSPAFCQILPAPAITCPLHPVGSHSHFLSHCGPHCRPRLLAHREAQGALFSCPDEIASMPVSLQTLKPAADRANPRIGVGALAFSPDNYFLATRNGQWPVPCVCCPLSASSGARASRACFFPFCRCWQGGCPAAVVSGAHRLVRAAAAQAQASVPSAPCLGKSRAPGPQDMPPFPAPRHDPGEGGHPHW